MNYDFKFVQEAAWIGLVAGAAFLLQWLIEFDPEIVTDWETYLKAIGAGLARAILAAVLGKVRPTASTA